MKSIDAQQLEQMRSTNPDLLLVNTLSTEHFAQTKIEGAENIPQESSDFAKRVEERLGGKDRPVVVYCASESCNSSGQAAEKLEKAGFQEVYDFEAGAEGWKEHQSSATHTR